MPVSTYKSHSLFETGIAQMDNYIKESLDVVKNKLPDQEVDYKQVTKNNGVTRDGFIINSKDTSILV